MGIIVNGQPVSGRMHPEAGHVRVRRMAGDDFAGACPFHGDCLEGLVAGPGIAARVGRPAQELAQDDPAWTFVADALAESFAGLFLTLACGRIVIGGGVGVGQPQLLDMVRAATVEAVGLSAVRQRRRGRQPHRPCPAGRPGRAARHAGAGADGAGLT